MANVQRKFPGQSSQDLSSIENLAYSEASGARKSAEVGRSLLPLGNGAGGYTTDASTARILPSAGRNLAIYNSDTAVRFVTISSSGATLALSNGATNANGNVAIACPPGTYTYVACYQNNWVVADSNKLYVYLIDDQTYVQ